MVLGLATGSTPIKVYEYLVQAHKEEGISFSNVISFNLDEYFPMDRESVHSYVRFMREHLFDHLDIPNTQDRQQRRIIKHRFPLESTQPTFRLTFLKSHTNHPADIDKQALPLLRLRPTVTHYVCHSTY